MGDECDKHLQNTYPTQEQLHKVEILKFQFFFIFRIFF